jgi:hypothetical protein
MQQADIKMLEKVVKVYTHRLRGPDTQLIPVAVSGVKDHSVCG